MVFETLNSILSTAVSITYTCCCAIVLMLHNGLCMASSRLKAQPLDIETNLQTRK